MVWSNEYRQMMSIISRQKRTLHSLRTLCLRAIEPGPPAFLSPGPVLNAQDVVFLLRFAGKMKLHFQNPENPPLVVGKLLLTSCLNDDLMPVFERIVREGMAEVQIKSIHFSTLFDEWEAVVYNFSNM